MGTTTTTRAKGTGARPGDRLDVAIVDAAKYPRKFRWGEVVDRAKIYACHDAQLDVLASKSKYTFAFAGSGGGKTCLIPLWLFKQLEKHRRKSNQPWRALIVSPTLATFESSQLKRHLIDVFAGTVHEGEWKDQKKTYQIPGGHEVVVKTAENDPKRLTGGQYDAIVLDECWAMQNPDIWEEVRRRSNILSAPILGVTTPNVDGWIYADVFQPWEAGDPEYYVRQWATAANPIKSPEEHARFLDAELAKMGRAKFDRMYGGQFAQLTGLVYEAFADPTAATYPVIPTPQRLPSPAVRAFGMIDWGYYPDPLAAYLCVHCEDDVIYVVEELYGVRIELSDIAVKLRDMRDRWSVRAASRYADVVRGGFFTTFYCDTSRPECASMMRQAGLPVTNKLVTEILAGVSVADQMFRANRVRIFDACTNLIREARAYAWDGDRPKAGNDHAMDALRYGLSSYMHKRAITPLAVAERTADEREREQLASAVKLGLISDDPQERDAQRLKEDRAKHDDWFRRMAYLGIDD